MKYIKLFLDYRYAVEPLSDAEMGRLFTALLDYAMSGEAPQLSGNERFLFPMMRAQIDRDIQELENLSEERSEAGKKGAEARASKAKQNKQLPNLPSKTSKDKDEDKDEDKDKDKDEDCNPPVSPLPGEPADLSAFDGDLKQAVEEWLRYKSERHESYKPTGHKLLLSQIANKAKEYGGAAVAEVIRTSISSGYKGIVFDRLERGKKREEPRADSREAAMNALISKFMQED